MPLFMPAIEIERAKVSYGLWRGFGFSKVATFGCLGSEEGESDFRPDVVGDHGNAFGIFQWHIDRVLAMLLGCKIDVRIAQHADQVIAAHWEMTKGGEKKTGEAFKAVTTIDEAVTVMVHVYERSASQASDIAKRTAMATYWSVMFKDAA
jgi:hypothetical protein